MKHKVIIPVTVDRDELMNSVMGSVWERWDWWVMLKFADGCDWKTYPSNPHLPYVKVGITDPDDPDEQAFIAKTLSVQDIVIAVGEVLTSHPWIRWDDMDACYGDVVMQTAMLGKVVYG